MDKAGSYFAFFLLCKMLLETVCIILRAFELKRLSGNSIHFGKIVASAFFNIFYITTLTDLFKKEWKSIENDYELKNEKQMYMDNKMNEKEEYGNYGNNNNTKPPPKNNCNGNNLNTVNIAPKVPTRDPNPLYETLQQVQTSTYGTTNKGKIYPMLSRSPSIHDLAKFQGTTTSTTDNLLITIVDKKRQQITQNREDEEYDSTSIM
jgi:hypothetical protein